MSSKKTHLKRIFLIRHGQSEGNVDMSRHAQIPDPVIKLTGTGKEQAFTAGLKLSAFLQEEIAKHPALKREKFRLWYSPFLRTRQTTKEFLEGFQSAVHLIDGIYQHPLLVEQSFGVFDGLSQEQRQALDPVSYAKMQNYSKHDCFFFAKPPQGESRFELYCRARPFNDLIMRQAENAENPIENVIVIAHSAVIRCLSMDMLHQDIDYFDKTGKLGNASIKLIESDKKGGYRERMIFDGFDAGLPRIATHQVKPLFSFQNQR